MASLLRTQEMLTLKRKGKLDWENAKIWPN